MKAAVANLTKTLALELGDRRIRVNCIAPDVIPTPGIGGDMPVQDAAARRRPRRRRRRARSSTSRPTGRASSPARRSTSTAATSPPAAGVARRRQLGDRGRPVERRVKFGVALGALNPHFHLDATLEAERLGYESVWLPEHLVFTRAMSRSPHPGEDHPPVPPDTPIYDAFAYLGFLAGATERVRLGTHVYNIGLRHPFTTARGVQTRRPPLRRPLRVRHRRVVARRGVGRGRARLRHARPARRRSDRGVQAPLDRGDGHAPRRVLLVRRGRVRAEAGAATPWPPILVGGESKAALRRAARLGDGWIGMGHTLESGGRADRVAAPLPRRIRPGSRTVSRSCSAVP